MIRQIEEKVVNRLRQVTSAIQQDGANQVSIITSTAERQAAIEFAKAAAMRPRIVGEALNQVAADPDVEARHVRDTGDSEDGGKQSPHHADSTERWITSGAAGFAVGKAGTAPAEFHGESCWFQLGASPANLREDDS